MEVELIAEFTDLLSHDRARNIIKRKRTKRLQPCSTISGTSSDCLIDNIAPDKSPVMSSEEDEDMANCLILLAQSESPVKEDDKSDQIRQKTEKLTSRRFTEMMTSDTGGITTGCFVYECKTCNRTFPSFQALGGHRASHKKPKVNLEEKKSSSMSTQPPLTEYSNEDNDQQEENKTSTFNNNVVKSPSPLPSPSTGLVQTANGKGKVHECSICGSEFSSGQALGGHMRKHRPVTASVNRLTESVAEKSTLSLDLNFPPPEVVDDVVQSNFQFTDGSSQQHMVFSAPALVGCHYWD